MSHPKLHRLHAPRLSAAAAEVLDLAGRLEDHGIAAWWQGEGLLDTLAESPPCSLLDPDRVPTQALLCAASPAMLRQALPHAVTTGAGTSRLTQANACAPVDLIPLDDRPIERVLLDFGLSALAFAYRPAVEDWCDPTGARDAFARGRLAPVQAPSSEALDADANPFVRAPRRYWIAARLLARYALEPDSDLLAAARSGLPQVLERLPQAAPARREIARILGARAPAAGLAFLRESGVSPNLFPGVTASNEARIARLPALAAIRWAAWLRGSATARALVRLRMPQRLARRIEQVQVAHPIDRFVGSMGDVGIRRLLRRLTPPEVEGLFSWRRIELDESAGSSEADTDRARLDEAQERIETAQRRADATGGVRALAIDGAAVMKLLATRPGPRVGRALAHLASFIAAHPEANEPEALEAELLEWSTHEGSVPA